MTHSIFLSESQKNILQQTLVKFGPITTIVHHIHQMGGCALIVGGAVRDLLLGLPMKDLDIEVYGLRTEQLQKILSEFGHVETVGKSFGVLRIMGLDIDWSLPRTDTAGRKPEVTVDPYMSIREAMRRRDLTMNAMGIDLITFELHDPFGGQQDMQYKILAAPDITKFIEDPLRFYRVMQFISRFEMYPNSALTEICKTMSLQGVSRERIEQEMYKLLMRSERPSLGLRWLQKLGRMHEIFPELNVLTKTPQEPDWHPEGNVFEHTMQAVDAAASRPIEDDHIRIAVLYAALCHDMGKALVTRIIDGRIRSIGHEIEGIVPAKSFLKRITHNQELIATVLKLVRYHMVPGVFVSQNSSPAAYKRLARKLAPETTIWVLVQLSIADKQGRNGAGELPLTTIPEDIKIFEQRAHEYVVLYQPEPPLLQGRDLMDILKPGPLMGQAVKRAYELQLQYDVQDKMVLKRMLVDSLRENPLSLEEDMIDSRQREME